MIFKNKKAELVKEKALVEIEDFSQKMLDLMLCKKEMTTKNFMN